MPETQRQPEAFKQPMDGTEIPDTVAKKEAVRQKYPDSTLDDRRTFEKLVGPNMQNLVRELEGKGFKITKQNAPEYDGATYLYATGPDGTKRWFVADTRDGGQLRVRKTGGAGGGPDSVAVIGTYSSLDAMMRDIGTWGGVENKNEQDDRRTFEKLVGPNMQNLVRELEGKGFKITKQNAPEYDGATYLYATGPDGTKRWFVADTRDGGQLRVRKTGGAGGGPDSVAVIGTYSSLDAMMRDIGTWGRRK